MTVAQELLAANAQYAAGFNKGDLPMPPGRKVAILTCMDARIDPLRALDLERGDAHIVRNAGAQATDDALRSAQVSRTMGTHTAIVLGHSDCGGYGGDDDAARAAARKSAQALEAEGFTARAAFFDVRSGDVTPLD